MRAAPLLALALVTFAATGCKGGGNSASLDLCGLNCPPVVDDNDNDDGGGDDTVPPGDDTTAGDGDNTGGNETQLTTGDTTLTFEGGKINKPESGTSLSRLTVGASPSKAMIEVDTKTDTNDTWLPPQEMAEYEPGTNAPNIYSPANLGANDYKEYRAISGSGTGRDEELQVWTFDNSYATQYRNVANGAAAQQAFSFGGNRTALTEMPTSASATYTGRFASTSSASNWLNPEPQDEDEVVIERNGKFVTNGSATITANFGSQTVNGTLQTERVRYHDGKQFLIYDTATDTLRYRSGAIYRKELDDGTFVAADPVEPEFWHTPVHLNGTITGNTYSGTAKLGGAFVSGDNPMVGGFFGTNASETTGAFAVRGVAVDPIGGEFPIDDDRRGFLSHSGVFHGQR